MSNKDLVLEIPYGTRDFLPREAAEKRAIEGKIAETFKRWGYDEVATPTIEFLDTLTMGNGSNLESKMFKLFDKENRTMALRYEMTTPIARVVASRLVDDLLPYKLSYISSVFRYEKTQTGRQCEFHQAGVELIGSSKATADAEVSDEEAAQKSMQYVYFSYTTTAEDGTTQDMTDDEKADVKAQAEGFAEGAAAAEDFNVYAQEQGLETSTATFDKDSTSPSADLVAAADALNEGEITGVIDTDSGCYVAKVTSLFDQDATNSKKQEIISQGQQEKYTETCDGWMDDADINVDKKVWKKIDFNDLSVTIKEESEEPYADSIQTDDVDESEDSGTEAE